MDKKRISCVIAGLLFIVMGVIIFSIKIYGDEIVLKISGGSIVVAGVAFLVESTKKKNK